MPQVQGPLASIFSKYEANGYGNGNGGKNTSKQLMSMLGKIQEQIQGLRDFTETRSQEGLNTIKGQGNEIKGSLNRYCL